MKIAFIGMGNMAKALVSGFVKSGFDAKRIFAYAPNQEKLLTNSKELGFVPCGTIYVEEDNYPRIAFEKSGRR